MAATYPRVCKSHILLILALCDKSQLVFIKSPVETARTVFMTIKLSVPDCLFLITFLRFAPQYVLATEREHFSFVERDSFAMTILKQFIFYLRNLTHREKADGESSK